MTQFWSIKTFVEWWNVFRQGNVIGIDQEGVNADYQTFSDNQIQQLLHNEAAVVLTGRRDRSQQGPEAGGTVIGVV